MNRERYVLECLCGARVESETCELKCTNCGIEIRAEWQGAPPSAKGAGA